MTTPLITVELPTCPTCGLASKVSIETYSGKSFCAGPKGARHKKVRMEVRKFVEVPVPKVEAS